VGAADDKRWQLRMRLVLYLYDEPSVGHSTGHAVPKSMIAAAYRIRRLSMTGSGGWMIAVAPALSKCVTCNMHAPQAGLLAVTHVA
jgi:hypothetical protein